MTEPSAAAKIRVLIADDHPIFRAGLRNLIDQQPDMQVVAEAPDGALAVQAYTQHRPDVALMDLRMPGLDGASAIAAVIRLDPGARIIVLSTYDADDDVNLALSAGARGYLRKDTFAEGILDAVRDVHAGEHLFPADPHSAPPSDPGRPVLSPRERAVLELVARGLSNKEIQTVLAMAEGTLKNHLKRIYEKLGVNARTRAAMLAVKLGLISS
jgi:two-component system NarL family response regulator